MNEFTPPQKRSRNQYIVTANGLLIRAYITSLLKQRHLLVTCVEKKSQSWMWNYDGCERPTCSLTLLPCPGCQRLRKVFVGSHGAGRASVAQGVNRSVEGEP